MKTIFKLTGLLIVVIIALGAAVYFTGNTMNVMVRVFEPKHGFDLSKKGPAPDYADVANWAARPGAEDLSGLVPAGVERNRGLGSVDVFFIHPTGYMGGEDWNWKIDPQTSTEQNTQWMLANQASVFSSCCSVYAPRYRQASIFAYSARDPEITELALAFAYNDIERAFDYFIATQSEGRPFIIASHSQGTHHASILLKERISGTPLRDRMVAAYLIGGDITHETLNKLPDIAPCDRPNDLHCVAHWATYGNGGVPQQDWINEGRIVCTNPISWRDDGARVGPEGHMGGVVGTGRFAIKMFGGDTPDDIAFGPLQEPIAEHTWAECRDSILFVADQSETDFGSLALPNKNYHGLDYPLFHMDIRENASARTSAYFASLQIEESDEPVPAEQEEATE
jgi:DUF3089 family protein